MKGIVEKQDLIESLNAVSARLNPEFTGLSAEVVKLLKKTKDLGLLSKSFILKDLKFKSDIDVLEAMVKVAKNMSDNIPDLINKIDETLPDKIPANSVNPNVRLALGISDTIIGYSESAFNVLNYVLDKYSNVTSPLNKDVVNDLKIVARVLKRFDKDYLPNVVNAIGELPVTKNREGTPMTIITSALTSKLGIKSSKILSGISELFNKFTGKGFTGNPIYHIRKFLVDLEINRLEKLKDQKRLIELKLQKLRLEQSKKPDDPKLEKQIEYYQNKLEKIELRIETIMES